MNLLQRLIIFLLQLHQARRTQTPFIVLADVLRFVQIQLHCCTLAFGKRIGFTFHPFAASFAGYYLVLCLHGTKINRDA